MEITLKQAVNKLLGNDKKLSAFKYYLKNSLRNTENNNTILKEGEVIEIQDGFVTIVFTWDNISAINNITHKYVDLISNTSAYEVFD